MKYIQRLIWKIRYAMEMQRMTKGGWRFCWQTAVAATGDDEMWLQEHPKDAVLEDLGYWVDWEAP